MNQVIEELQSVHRRQVSGRDPGGKYKCMVKLEVRSIIIRKKVHCKETYMVESE